MHISFDISTTQQVQFADITSQIHEAIENAGIKDGIIVVYVPHTTAGITVNENADPSVKGDIIMQLERLVPERGVYAHAEGNSPAHIKVSIVGSSLSAIVSGGRLNLGNWQGIFFCEFDGPRSRKVWIKIIEG